MCKSAKKQFAELGVEVYEVGVKQVRGWFGWRGCKFTGRNIHNMAAMCDTMRKGAYLVVVGYACFGYLGQTLSIYGDGSVSYAVWYVRQEMGFNEWAVSDHYLVDMPKMQNRYQHEIEIWHLVDDGELWQEWECRSAQYVALNGDLDEYVVLQPDYLTLPAFRAMDPELGDVRYKYFLARLFGIPTGMTGNVMDIPTSFFEVFSPDDLTLMELRAASIS